MSVRKAAQALGVHPITIRRLMRDGKIAYREVDGIKRNRFRIPESEIARLLKEHGH